MSVPTDVERALERVRAEREAVDAKVAAIETFVDRVAALPTESGPSPAAPSAPPASAGTLSPGNRSTEDRCRAVRTAFDETIRPHSVADVDGSESLLATVRKELSVPVAVALAPSTAAVFSAELKASILSEAGSRRAEAAVLRRALAREEPHLEEACAVVDDVTAWIAEAAETPLSDLDFVALRDRHETLATHRDRCGDLSRRRQEFLDTTAHSNVEAGIRHRNVLPYLYRDLPVDHPLLAAVVRLDSVCAECQRAVRGHLVRRV